MKKTRLGVVVTACLFFGWLGWLGYLAIAKSNPIVMSRSQMMAATHFVIAEVHIDADTRRPDREVKIIEDLRPRAKVLEGTIRVANLPEARISGAKGFRNGAYLLPLTSRGDGTFELTVQPPSPGQEGIKHQSLRPWAYLWESDQVKRQFEVLAPAKVGH